MDVRIIVASPQDELLYEIAPNDLFNATLREKINGEHSMTIVTTRHLEKEQRILTQDQRGRWREFVVMGTDKKHENNERPFGEYTCVWSLQHDLRLFKVDEIPGLDSPVNARTALAAVLSGTKRWGVGTVTRSATGGADMTQTNGWAALSTLIETWGGEVDAMIAVGPSGVTSRKVCLYEKIGTQTAKRRFDYSKDLTSIRRKVDESPVACRIRPYGKGTKNIDGLDIKLTIEEVNDGKDYLQNDQMAPLLRMPDGQGGWEYPTLDVENSSLDDDELLLEWGQSVLSEYTTPKVTYQSTVLQLSTAGMDVYGVDLGDLVQCVDKGFSEEGVRIEVRVIQQDIDLLDPSNTELTMGDAVSSYVLSIGSTMASMRSSIASLSVSATTTADYLDHLLDHLNEQINATGGYTYITEGYGIRTYDKAVSDPLVGAEATSVVEIRGGTIRIADSKTAQGEWEWRSVLVAGHIAADMITAANITAGYIGSPDGVVYIDLDNRIFNVGESGRIGNRTVSTLLADVDSAGITKIEYGTSTSSSAAPTSWSETEPASVTKGTWLWIRTTYKSGDVITSKAYAGEDGTSVSILGSYDTLAQLEAAHPTGNQGDGYLVDGDLYVWNGARWLNVGRIQGPAGQDGTSVTVSAVEYATSTTEQQPSGGWSATAPSTVAEGSWLWVRTTYSDGTTAVTRSKQGKSGLDGTSVTVSKVEYGTSASASAQPSSWSTTVPTAITKGMWLWVKTTYSDGGTATTKSYVGTDGRDGTSVYITSSTKSGGVTTVTLSDGTTLEIADGEDGANGTNGQSGYVHVAWANSSDGRTDFSTTASAGKTYLGVYTDATAADSQSPSDYSWSLIKGATGEQGIQGVPGEAARSYGIDASPSALIRGADGTLSPSTIALTATVAVGNSAPEAYYGRFRIEEFDGAAWSTKHTSTYNVSSYTHTVSDAAKLVRCTLYAAGGITTALDTQTVHIVSDGADGIDGTDGRDGIDGEDAYSVMLTNESHTFPATSSAALGTSVTTRVLVYKGATKLPASIGTISGLPTGLTATKLSNGTANAGITFTASTSLTTRSGTVSIPVTADGQSFATTFSWALALEGVGIASIVPQYYLSTSSTTQTGGSWSANEPTWSSGKYIWTRNYVTWDDGTTETTTPALASALNSANQQAVEAKAAADDAAKVATNYLTFSQSTGLDVGYSNTKAKTRVSGDGVELFDANGKSGAKLEDNLLRLGKTDGARMLLDSGEQYIKMLDKTTKFFYIGYRPEGGEGDAITLISPVVELGEGARAGSYAQTVIGRYNKVDKSNKYAFIIGNGTSSSRANAFALTWDAKSPLKTISGTSNFGGGDFNTCTTFRAYRCLNVVQVYITVRIDSGVEISAGESLMLGTLPSGWRPVSATRIFSGSVNRQAGITTGGVVTLYTNNKISGGSSISVFGTYIIPE